MNGSQLRAYSGEHGYNMLATALWREGMGQRLDKDDARLLAAVRGDPKAETAQVRQWEKALATTAPEKVDPGVRTAVAEATDRVLATPQVRDAMERAGMAVPPIFVMTGREHGGEIPQAEWIGGHINVYDAGWLNPHEGQNIGIGTPCIGGGTWDAVVTHEIGHGVEESMTGSQLGNTPEWAGLYRAYQNETQANFTDQASRISYYSLENSNEGFAETFALVMHGDYDKDAYGPAARAMIDYMEQTVR